MTHESNKIFPIEKDLETDKVLKRARKHAFANEGSVLFDPDEWRGRDDELKIELTKLSGDELRK